MGAVAPNTNKEASLDSASFGHMLCSFLVTNNFRLCK